MKVKRNSYDIFSEIVSVLCIVGVILYLILTWDKIPNEIPGHYNGAGEIDKITNKNSLIVLQVVTIIMYLFLSIIERIPQIWNTGGVKITEENKELIYRTIKNLSVFVKMNIVLAFSYLTINSSKGRNLPMTFTPIFLIAIFGTIIYFTIKLLRIK